MAITGLARLPKNRILSMAVVRPLRDNETILAHEWAVNEGWNPGPCDGLVFNAADPGSLLTLDIGGSPVGVISAMIMTENYGHLGFFVLDPTCRRSTYGWNLLHAGFDRMGDRTVGGDGVFEHLRGYARFGLLPHYVTMTYQGHASESPRPWQPGIEDAAEASPVELAAYDAANFGVMRGTILREWLALPTSRSLVFRREGRICGLGAVRRCHHGLRIGPLQADDAEVAEALFDALCAVAPGEEVSVDCPEPNSAGIRLLSKKGLVPTVTTARLYRGDPPAARIDRIYSLMSFSLG